MSSDIAELRNLRGVIAEFYRAEPSIGLRIRKIVFPLLYNPAIEAQAKLFLNNLEDFERALIEGHGTDQIEALRQSVLASLDKLNGCVKEAPRTSTPISIRSN